MTMGNGVHTHTHAACSGSHSWSQMHSVPQTHRVAFTVPLSRGEDFRPLGLDDGDDGDSWSGVNRRHDIHRYLHMSFKQDPAVVMSLRLISGWIHEPETCPQLHILPSTSHRRPLHSLKLHLGYHTIGLAGGPAPWPVEPMAC